MASSEHVDVATTRKSQLCEEKVANAVSALYKHQELRDKKKPLFGDSVPINLQVTLWDVPVQKNKRYKLCVPHGYRGETSDICLITKDEGKTREESARFYEKLLAKKGVKNISRVIPLQTLRKEYRPFEARRKLVMSYDLFLADDRIFRLLDTCTGKEFHRKKKYPVAVNIMKSDLVKEINSSINAVYFTLVGRGACSGVTISNTSLTQEQTVDNVMSVVESLAFKVPKGWSNIKCLYVKTAKSMSIPIYASLDYNAEGSEDAPIEAGDPEASEDDGIESDYEDSGHEEDGGRRKRKQSPSKQTVQKKIKTEESKESESGEESPEKQIEVKKTPSKRGRKSVSKVK